MGDARHVDGGVTSAAEARLAESGLIAPLSTGALDVRTGVMAGPGSTAVVAGTSATGQMTVQVNPHVSVTTRGSANGVYLGPVLAAATTVNIAAAPGTGSRIDVVYVKQQDSTSGVPSPDVTTAPLYGVVTGTSGASPTKPSIASITGAEELATVQVNAGATSTNGSGVTITNTARQTVARGGIVPARSTDTDAGAYVDQYRSDPVRGLQRWNGSAWVTVAAVPDASWIRPTLLNSWVNYGAPYPLAGYRKLSSGQVEIRGMLKNGLGNVGAVFFQLPAGYRPGGDVSGGGQLIFPSIAADLLGEFRIDGNGNVALYAGGTAFFSLACTFYAEA